MPYFTYIIYSPTLDKYYTGQCQDINARLDDHNNWRSGFTKSAKDWELKWKKIFETRSQAILEESRIKKKKSRKYIEFLIQP